MLLRDTLFLRLWLVGGIAGTIRWLEILAVSLYTLRQTESPLLVSLLIFARMLPPLVLGTWMGATADRIQRARMLRYGLAGMVVVSLLLALLAAAGWLQLWQLAIGAALSGAFWSMEHTVRRPLLGDIVGDARIGRALSLDSATFNATRMAGPLAGGALFTVLGLAGVYVCSLVAYGLALTALMAPAFGARKSSVKHSCRRLRTRELLRELLPLVRADKRIPAVLAVTVTANFFGFAYASMAPVVGERVLALGPVAIGMLLAAEGMGAFLGALSLAAFARPNAYLRIFGAGTLIFFAAILAFSASRTYVWSVAALLCAGLGVAGFSAMQSAILLLATPPQARSRVMGLLVVCIGAQPFGVLHAGLLANWLGAATALMVLALEGLVTLTLCFYLWPHLLPMRPVDVRDR